MGSAKIDNTMANKQITLPDPLFTLHFARPIALYLALYKVARLRLWPRFPRCSTPQVFLACLVVLVAAKDVRAEPPVDPERAAYFESHVRPLLLEKCAACHGADEQESQLRLDTAEGLFQGGKSGPVVVPGAPHESLLLTAVRRAGELKMPPDEPLTAAEVADLEKWIRAGAIWPGYESVRPDGNSPGSSFSPAQKAHWAYQPINHPELPTTTNDWCFSPIDGFVLNRLTHAGLTPAATAARGVLLRRIYFDLIGLPPRPAEIDRFLADESPVAMDRVVDRLLASPHYGERWGRHWLDVARYSDTTGQEADWVMRFAYRYRDYVISALNRDKPYDEFIVEQLAGDLLPKTNDIQRNIERLCALGFLMLSPKATAENDKELMVLDVVDEQIDVTGRAFLAMTIACARCHDHKFDPIPTLDYYSIAGIFRSTETMVGLNKGTSNWVEFPLEEIYEHEAGKLRAGYKPRIQALQAALAHRATEVDAAQARWEQTVLSDDFDDQSTTPDDMIVYCPLDDENATVAGMPVKGLIRGQIDWTAGMVSGALQLSGTGHIELQEVGHLERDNRFSYGAWIYPTSEGMQTILSKMDEKFDSRGWDLWLRDGRVYVHLIHKWHDSGGNAIRVITRRALSLNQWHHVMATYDGSSQAAGVKIYVDGVEHPLERTHDNLTGSLLNEAPLCVGRRTPGSPFQGMIDDIRIYERELSAFEVSRLADNLPEASVTSAESISDLHAWYTAESVRGLNDGERLGAWLDSNRSGKQLVLSSESPHRPTYVAQAIHHRPALRFAARESFLRTDEPLGLSGEQEYTLFVVLDVRSATDRQNHVLRWGQPNDKAGGILLEIDSTESGHDRLDIATGHSNDAWAGPLQIPGPQLWSVRYVGGEIASHIVKVDGEVRSITSSGRADKIPLAVIDGELVLGGNGTEASRRLVGPDMDIAEVVIYRRALAENEERALGLYFTRKYQLANQYDRAARHLVKIPPEDRTDKQRDVLRQLYLTQFDESYRRVQEELDQVQAEQQHQIDQLDKPMVMAVREQRQPADLHVYIRGDYNQKGPLAPRRFLQIVAGEGHSPINTEQSGRLELAHWIADATNPLTPRVIVNRLWQSHFGRGIVPHSDNFGVLGGKPSHPQLLDWLAARLLERNWSLKTVHRAIVNTNTYRQAWVENSAAEQVDPENRLHWRRERRRLEAEPIRDAMLTANEQLDRTLGGMVLPDWWVEAEIIVDADAGLTALAEPADKLKAYESSRRAVYLPVSRNQLYEMFRLFDYADASSVVARRDESTVAPQALFMLNNEFVIQQARRFAELLLVHGEEQGDEELLRLAHVKAFGRLPNDLEIAEGLAALHFLSGSPDGVAEADQLRLAAWQEYCHVLFCQNEFAYIE